jgi:LysM repeat protein
VLVHKVDLDDTLEGLSLQYGVSPNVIKEFNGLSSDSIYYLKEIRIPDPKEYYASQVHYIAYRIDP